MTFVIDTPKFKLPNFIINLITLKMNTLQIFDKNGNALNVADVIYGFIKDRAKKAKKDIEDVFVGVDVGFPKGKPIWVYTTESVNNGYDGIDLNEFGDSIKVD